MDKNQRVLDEKKCAWLMHGLPAFLQTVRIRNMDKLQQFKMFYINIYINSIINLIYYK